jgi:hypothetical protein
MNGEGTATRTARVPHGFWAVVALVVWALAITTLLHREPYGLDEATARTLVFLWSVTDQVASPIVTIGIPDFRAVYLIPVGIPFSGSLLAAKLLTALISIACAMLLYRWRQRAGEAESALLSSGLLLLAPIVTTAIDGIAIGPYLLLTIALAVWADLRYRETRTRFGGLYFALVFLCIAAVSLHPAGLALPIVLILSWLREGPQDAAQELRTPIPGRERTHMLAGFVLASVLGLLIAAGWRQQTWLANPIVALARDGFGFQSESSAGDTFTIALGIACVVALLASAWWSRAAILSDRMAGTLVLAIGIGAWSGDSTFVLLSFTFLLVWGSALILRVQIAASRGFIAQRGVAFVLLLVLATSFLSTGRARFEQVRQGPELSATDEVLRALSEETGRFATAPVAPGAGAAQEKARGGPRVASQWPGRTMIACRCSALPLPPALEDSERFVANLRGIDFVVFDPQDPANRPLARAFSLMNGAQAETIVLQAGGVVLRLHRGADAPAAPSAPSTPMSRQS